MLELRLRTLLLVVTLVWCGWILWLVATAEHRVTLRGKLYASEEQISNGLFFTVGDDDSESITLQVTPDGPLAGWLAGTITHGIIITLEPLP